MYNLSFSFQLSVDSPGFHRVMLISMETTLCSSENAHIEKQPFWKKALCLKSN